MRLGKVCQTRVVTATPDTSLAEASRIMRRMQVGALVIVEDRGGRQWPVGIVTDRDLATAMTVRRDEPRCLGDVMSRDLVVARDDADFFVGLTRMRRAGVRRLPIVARDGSLAGIITLDDVIEILSAKLREAASIVPRERSVEAREAAAAAAQSPRCTGGVR